MDVKGRQGKEPKSTLHVTREIVVFLIKVIALLTFLLPLPSPLLQLPNVRNK